MNDLLHHITWALVVFAAVNWGLVGLFDINLVHSMFGTMPMIEKYAYVTLGVAGIIFAILEARDHKLF